MKQRLQNWLTTSIGAVLMLTAIIMYVLSKIKGYEVSIMETASVAILGWVFLTARDTLLEGVFMNLFKINKKADKE
jgi:phosphate/sulfate permease